MSGESTQMAEPNKTAVLSPTHFLPKIQDIGKVPKDFMGCKCPETVDFLSPRMPEVVRQCDKVNCPCWMKLYVCTSKCKCQSCANCFVVRGSGSSTEPGQGGTNGVSNVPDETTPPPNIEPEQADDSGMSGEPRQMAEPNKTAVPSPHFLPKIQDIGKVPKDFMGCKCSEMVDFLSPRMREVVRQCDNANCPCRMKMYVCTSKCKCQSCANCFMVRGSGSSTEPGQGGTTSGVSNVTDETIPLPNIEPEQGDDTSGMAREPPQMEEQSSGNYLNELPSNDGGFDLNKLP